MGAKSSENLIFARSINNKTFDRRIFKLWQLLHFVNLETKEFCEVWKADTVNKDRFEVHFKIGRISQHDLVLAFEEFILTFQIH